MYTRSVRCLTSRLRLACAWIWIFRSACFNFCCRKSLLIFKVKSAGWLYEVCIYWNFFVLHTYMLRGHRAWLVVLPYSRIVSTWLMAQQMWQSRAVSIFLILRFPGTLTALRCHWTIPVLARRLLIRAINASFVAIILKFLQTCQDMPWQESCRSSTFSSPQSSLLYLHTSYVVPESSCWKIMMHFVRGTASSKFKDSSLEAVRQSKLNTGSNRVWPRYLGYSHACIRNKARSPRYLVIRWYCVILNFESPRDGYLGAMLSWNAARSPHSAMCISARSNDIVTPQWHRHPPW